MTGDDEGSATGTASDGERDPTSDATVLVVDDEAAVVESFTVALEMADYEVRTAKNGGEALVELGPDVDVVLLDRRMPGMSGDEVLEHIQEWQSDCRVVVVTAVDPDVDIVDMAFDDYLTKPVSQSELTETVEQLLLFDRYEQLLHEYHSLTRKYATLQSTFDDHEFSDTEAVQRLEERCDEARAALEETIGQFSDEDVSSVLERAHGELP